MILLRTLVTASLVAPLFAAPAYSQADQTASLLEALSLVSGRMLVAPTLQPEVTRDGDQFHVHIPLPRLTTPPDASINVAAIARTSGVWDITELTIPSTGTLVMPAAPNAPPMSVRFSIGQQTAHGRIDPTLSLSSPYAMALSEIVLHIESSASPANLTIGQMTLDGTITGDAEGHVTTRARSSADNWHFLSASKTGPSLRLSLRSVNTRYDIDGLDRAKAERLREAVKSVSPTQQAVTQVPGQAPPTSPALRGQLRALIDGSAGLLSNVDIEEIFQGLHFETAGGNHGDVGEIRLEVATEAADNRMAGHCDISLDHMTLAAAVPTQFSLYAPRRIALKAAVSGIPAESLRDVLREATEANADLSALWAQAIALLGEPGAGAGLETMLIESGPLLLQGTGRIRPMPNGSAAFEVHLTAHGLDAMQTLIQSDPGAQQIMPMLFLARGMGKQEGDGLAWDISLTDGIVTVNGISMGQNVGGVPGPRPPTNR